MNFKKIIVSMMIATSVMTSIPTSTAFAARAQLKIETTSVKDDIKSALKEKDEEDKEAASKKATADKKKEIGAQASKAAAKVVANLINGKYESTDEAVEDIAMTTLKFVNENLISEIPYVGKFSSALISELTGTKEEDPVGQKLDAINEQLKKINATIENCTAKIMDQQVRIVKNQKIMKINEAYVNILKMYRKTLIDYKMGMMTIADVNKRSTRGAELKTAVDTLANVYSAKTLDAFNEYKAFCDTITSKEFRKGYLINPETELDPDVFTAYNDIVKNSNVIKLGSPEYMHEKDLLINNVEETCSYGYNMLSTIMKIEIANQEGLKEAYAATIKELNKKSATAKGKNRNTIDQAISDATLKFNASATAIDAIKADLAEVEGKMNDVKDYVKAERAADEGRRVDYWKEMGKDRFERTMDKLQNPQDAFKLV